MCVNLYEYFVVSYLINYSIERGVKLFYYIEYMYWFLEKEKLFVVLRVNFIEILICNFN